jgi:hypothetical protein
MSEAPEFKHPAGTSQCPKCGEDHKDENLMRAHWSRMHNEPAPWWPAREKAERYGLWWKHQRKRAKERDEHCCQNCESITGDRFGDELHVHHIRPCKAFPPGEFPHRLSNLVTLCVPCHRLLEYADESTQRAVLECEAFHPAAIL